MLIIILGCILSILIGLAIGMKDVSIGVAIMMFGIFASLILGLFSATKYGERQLEEQTELVSLSNSTISEGGGFIYVSISGENAYTYRYEVDTDLGTKTSKNYAIKTISSSEGKIIESEDINCKVPVLLKYKTKSKITIWSFGFLDDKIEYVFYVPKGTIQKDVKLN